MSTKMGTGNAKGDNSKDVAKQAVQQALQALDGAPVHLAMVYVSCAYDYQEVVDVVREATNKAPLVGSSTAGEFTEGGVSNGGISVGLLSSDSMHIQIASATGIRADVEAAMKAMRESLPGTDTDYPHQGVILLADGLAGVGEELTLMASVAFGSDIAVFGGTAGDEFNMKRTVVFHDDKVLDDAAVCCHMASKVPFFMAVNHGHAPCCEPLKITRAEGNVLKEVDGRPAWEVWKEKARDSAAKLGIVTDNLTKPDEIGAFFANYEMGLKVDDEHYKVRYPAGINEDGSINFTCGIAEGSVFQIMDGSQVDDLIEAAGKAAASARDKAKTAGFEKIGAVLVFECAVRAVMLQDRFYEGVDRFKAELGPVPIVGFESYGEICLEPGEFSGYHNTTSVVVLLPDA